MAQTQYGTLITTIGLAQIANAQITQTKVGLEYIALGDGNGAHYVPTQNQTALVHEVWRGPIAELSIDPTNSNRIIVDAVIPVTAGGFTIREIGVFDDKNQLIAVGQYPEKYKPQLSEGVSEETIIHFVIETNNADVVKLTIDPTVIIASRNYVDGKVAQVQKSLTEHSADSVTSENGVHKLRYFNNKLECNDGVKWNEIKTEIVTKSFTGDLNNLVENGIYSVPVGTLNVPISGNWLISVEVSLDGKTIWQEARTENQNNPRDNFFRRLGLRGGDGVVNWSVTPSNIPGYLNGWKYANLNLSNAVDSHVQVTAASSYAVKQVNDKLIGYQVVIGNGAKADVSLGVISIGKNANVSGANAIGLGADVFVIADNSVAIGAGSLGLTPTEGVLGGPTSNSSSTNKWKIPGNLSVSGTKNFEIPHPHPNKKHTHVIRHGAVESPTTGDTLYRYTVEAQMDGETVEVQLPDYFEYLNTNVDVWVNPDEHFGRAFGKVLGDKLLITCEKIGKYKALVIGTRNDDNVQDWYVKGVEREIGESWLGETYIFEVEEITEVAEFEEVSQ